MAIVTPVEVKEHLGITNDTDDALLEAKTDAAQAHIESWLGHDIVATYTPVPADLKEAVLSLTAHLFENREASIVGLTIASVPLSVRDIIAARRDRTF